ncbi:uncharacterized protein LOC114754298 [Neltuma alba]|uniref:uncharacterized protein LOC114754298 n=1 Tax=Neltuma alba TaxID=207710 RepID=UPI0010A56730|nr:uncharacterized protein LOC114754298 [Prosopis alba]
MNLPLYVDNAYESWTNLKKAFLDKYFPSIKISVDCKEISVAKQEPFETFFEFWNRFQEMLTWCPNHQILEEYLTTCELKGFNGPQDPLLVKLAQDMSKLASKTTIPKALLDLGASINVMPRSMYESLQIKSLKPTTMMLQLADRTIRYPYNFLEDILVKVKDLVIPADFYVLDMPNGQGGDGTLILGRPFLRTANTNIDM